MTAGGNTIAKSVPPHCHTRSEAAFLVGKSIDTLRRWHRAGLVVPSQSMQAGHLRVWLYTDDDLLELRRVAKTIKPGRKPSTGSVT